MWFPTNVGLRVAELVGEASNPGPRIRRLLRPVEGRDVSRKTTQEDSDSDAPLLRPVVANVEGETIPASSGAVVAFRRGGDNELLLHRASNTTPSVQGESPHPTRRSARLQSMGSRAGHRRGLVVEVAPNVVDATAVALPHVITDVEFDFDASVPVFDPLELDVESGQLPSDMIPGPGVQILEQVWEVPSTMI